MVIKGFLQEVTGINIIMFAAYGYRSSNRTGFGIPFKLPGKNCKSLIDINFSPSELKIYVEKFCSNYFNNLDQQNVLELYQYIQVVTEGHAGLVRHILVSIEDALKNRIDTMQRPFLSGHFFSRITELTTVPILLPQICVKIFTAMCNELSGKILRETLGFGSDGRILEQAWQKEFYRIGTRVLGRVIFCHVMWVQFLDVMAK